MIFQGIRTSIAKKPSIFVIFQGGVPHPLWIYPCFSYEDPEQPDQKCQGLQVYAMNTMNLCLC